METPIALTVQTNPTVRSAVRETNTCAIPTTVSLRTGSATGGWIALMDRTKLSVMVNS